MARKKFLCVLCIMALLFSSEINFFNSNYGGVSAMETVIDNHGVYVLVHDAPFSVGKMKTNDPSDNNKPLATFSGTKLAFDPSNPGTQLITPIAPCALDCLGLVAPVGEITNNVLQIPAPLLTNTGTIMLSEPGTPILSSEHTIPVTPLMTKDGTPVLTDLGTPVYISSLMSWRPKVKENYILALLGDYDEILSSVVEPADSANNNTGTRAQQRQAERKRDKQKQFLAERERLCSKIRSAYDNYVEAEFAYEYYVHLNGEIDGSYELKEKYDRSISLLNSAINEYNNTVKNAAANFVLSTADNIIFEMRNSEKRNDYFVDPDKDFSRNRLITLQDLFYFLMTLDRKSVDKELFDFFWGNEDDIPSASAMNQQRHKLKPEGARHLFIALAKELTRVQNPTCKGLPIWGFDGTDSDTWPDETAENYMEGKNGKKGYNQNHIVTFGNILSGLYLDCVIQPRPKTNETKAAVEMIKRNKFIRPVIALADRGFASFNLIETCRLNGVHPCFRIREDFCKESKNMPLKEHDEVFTTTIFTRQTKENKDKIKAGLGRYLSGESPFGKYKKNKSWDYGDNYTMSFRIVRFSIGTNEDGSTKWETIMTTLPQSEFSLEDIKELYHLRWTGVEVSYRYLKYDANLSYYHCKLPEFIDQEIYARFTMYNICQTIMNLAVYGQNATNFELDLHANTNTGKATSNNSVPEVKSDVSADLNETHNENQGNEEGNGKTRKYDYQINHSMAFYVICSFIRNKGDVPFDVIELIKKYLLPIRSGRKFEMNISPQSFKNFWYR